LKALIIDDFSRNIVEEIQQSFSQDEILVILQDIANQFEFEFFTYARIFPKAMTQLDIIILGNFPNTWSEEYINNRYIFIDPTIKHCTSSTLPYYWKNIFLSEDEDVKKFAAACSGFGLKEGFSIGITGNCGDFSIVSLGKSKTEINPIREFNQAVMVVHSILPYLHEKFAQINPVNAIYPVTNQQYHNPLHELTVREKECLLWSAEGKTAFEIAIILEISESTISFHLKNSAIKLDCANKTHAVAKAVLLGLIKNMPDT